jgi:hypothetical protein
VCIYFLQINFIKKKKKKKKRKRVPAVWVMSKVVVAVGRSVHALFSLTIWKEHIMSAVSHLTTE